jgi:hypothetical protein
VSPILFHFHRISLTAALLNQLLSVMDNKLTDMEHRQQKLESHVKRLVQATDGGEEEPKVEDSEGMDRKRLKERFLKSLMLDKGPLASLPHAAGAWMELILGIGPPDQRMGKEGSRSPPSPPSPRPPPRFPPDPS